MSLEDHFPNYSWQHLIVYPLVCWGWKTVLLELIPWVQLLCVKIS